MSFIIPMLMKSYSQQVGGIVKYDVNFGRGSTGAFWLHQMNELFIRFEQGSNAQYNNFTGFINTGLNIDATDASNLTFYRTDIIIGIVDVEDSAGWIIGTRRDNASYPSRAIRTGKGSSGYDYNKANNSYANSHGACYCKGTDSMFVVGSNGFINYGSAIYEYDGSGTPTNLAFINAGSGAYYLGRMGNVYASYDGFPVIGLGGGDTQQLHYSYNDPSKYYIPSSSGFWAGVAYVSKTGEHSLGTNGGTYVAGMDTSSKPVYNINNGVINNGIVFGDAIGDIATNEKLTISGLRLFGTFGNFIVMIDETSTTTFSLVFIPVTMNYTQVKDALSGLYSVTIGTMTSSSNTWTLATYLTGTRYTGITPSINAFSTIVPFV